MCRLKIEDAKVIKAHLYSDDIFLLEEKIIDIRALNFFSKLELYLENLEFR